VRKQPTKFNPTSRTVFSFSISDDEDVEALDDGRPLMFKRPSRRIRTPILSKHPATLLGKDRKSSVVGTTKSSVE
jgi:hypothetical protein